MEPQTRAVVSARLASTMSAMSARHIATGKVMTAVTAMTATAFVIACQLALLTGCPGHPQPPQRVNDTNDTPLRIRIANAEALRAGGLTELVELATHGTRAERMLALRGLGRIGGKRALDVLVTTLADPDAEVVAEAAGAIGLATSLDEADAGTAELSRALLAVQGGTHHVDAEVIVIEALGRAADATAQPRLARGLGATEPRIAAASAIALGRHGRRKIELAAPARQALVVALRHADGEVRFAAAYALAREQLPATPSVPREPDPLRESGTQLARLVADPMPEVRAQAVAALARRKWVIPARNELEAALRDRDWRVAAEAVRALTGEASDVKGHEAVAMALDEHLARLLRGEPTEAHVIEEGLRLLANHAGSGGVAGAIEGFARRADKVAPPIARGWIECLANLILVRATRQPFSSQTQCGHGGLPEHLRLPLLAELITAGVGSLETRRDALRLLLGHADPRVRAAGLGTLAPLWKAGDANDHRAAISTLVAAFGSRELIVSGTAIEAAAAIYTEIGEGDHADLDAALIARAQIEQEPELGAALLELIGKRTIAAGASACRGGLTAAPVIAAAAAKCLAALGEPAPPLPVGVAALPPVDVAQVIGRSLRWHLLTTRGDIVIGLRPDVAPWAVATVVALTRKGFYDGLEFHRVVANFVVQGGDPTETGWGGVGFSLPSEPSTGAGFVTGGVGIPDGGRDSGNGQLFVMHSRAAHLDGRYTWIGRVESGQKSADALLIGDEITRAVIEVVPAREK